VASGAHLSVTDQRRAARHPVDHPVIAEHRDRGDVALRIVNLSAHGFMVNDGQGLERGDRVVIRLPHIGRIEAYAMWCAEDGRIGFQFERIIRMDDFVQLIDKLQPNPRLRRRR
jgi:hypothetical protein